MLSALLVGSMGINAQVGNINSIREKPLIDLVGQMTDAQTNYYGYYAMPVNWVVAGLVSGLAESLTAGLLVGLIYKPIHN